MDKKKLKLSISGNTKKTISNIEQAKSNPKNTVIIEDSSTGLQSASKSKAKVIGLTTSLTENQIKDIDKSIIIANSYNEISTYVALLK